MTILFNSVADRSFYGAFAGLTGNEAFFALLENDETGSESPTKSVSDDGTVFIREEREIVRKPGNVALRSQVVRNYPDVRWFRAEAVGAEAGVNRELTHASKEVYWLAFSIWSHPSNVFDEENEVIFQSHSPVGALVSTSPSLGIYVQGQRFFFNNRYSVDGVVASEGTLTCLSDVIQHARWYDFVIKTKVDYEDPGVGYVWIWINGRLVMAKNCPTAALFDDMWFSMQWGCYKFAWANAATPDNAATSRIYIHDEVRIGDADESYASMAVAYPNLWLPTAGQGDLSMSRRAG